MILLNQKKMSVTCAFYGFIIALILCSVSFADAQGVIHVTNPNTTMLFAAQEFCTYSRKIANIEFAIENSGEGIDIEREKQPLVVLALCDELPANLPRPDRWPSSQKDGVSAKVFQAWPKVRAFNLCTQARGCSLWCVRLFPALWKCWFLLQHGSSSQEEAHFLTALMCWTNRLLNIE